jgi:hypothetical protein
MRVSVFPGATEYGARSELTKPLDPAGGRRPWVAPALDPKRRDWTGPLLLMIDLSSSDGNDPKARVKVSNTAHLLLEVAPAP